jgi:hypothetical protein
VSEYEQRKLQIEAAQWLDSKLERFLEMRGEPSGAEDRRAFMRTVVEALEKTDIELSDELNALHEVRFTVREVRASDYWVSPERANELEDWIHEHRMVVVRGRRGFLVEFATRADPGKRDTVEVTTLKCELEGNVGPLGCTPAEVVLA